MSDDLVKRLRERAANFRNNGLVLCEDYDEAADRIEELEKERGELGRQVRDLLKRAEDAESDRDQRRDVALEFEARADRLAALLREAEAIARKEAAYWEHVSSPRYETAVKIADRLARLEAREVSHD